MILYVNACVREESRTNLLAQKLLAGLGQYEEVRLDELGLEPLTRETLSKRTELIEAGNYEDPMFDLARQFAQASVIVIAAPYWDMGFPALLKIYLENIYVTGIVSKYDAEGRPVGLCKAEKAFYITTAGGPYMPDYSYNYIRDMFRLAFGISETELLKAQMLDVVGQDVDAIMEGAYEEAFRMGKDSKE